MAAYRRVDGFKSPAGWLPIHRDQLRAQRSVTSMGALYLFTGQTRAYLAYWMIHFAAKTAAKTAQALERADNPQTCPFSLGDLDRPHLVPWTHPSQPPNGMWIGSAVFAGLTNVTNRQTDKQTDRPRYCVCSNRPLSLAIAAMLQ